MKTIIQERRRFPRTDVPSRVAVNLLQPQASVAPNSINVSRGGLCLRLEDMLEVRSFVRLQLTRGHSNATRAQRSVECTGRVAWVIQRMDLRNTPPFLFDVGIEFVDPPPIVRQLLAQQGGLAPFKGRPVRVRTLEPSTIRGRCYVPHLEREVNHALHWHLIVWVDGTPCFSGHYGTERAALVAWAKFRRQQTKP